MPEKGSSGKPDICFLAAYSPNVTEHAPLTADRRQQAHALGNLEARRKDITNCGSLERPAAKSRSTFLVSS